MQPKLPNEGLTPKSVSLINKAVRPSFCLVSWWWESFLPSLCSLLPEPWLVLNCHFLPVCECRGWHGNKERERSMLAGLATAKGLIQTQSVNICVFMDLCYYYYCWINAGNVSILMSSNCFKKNIDCVFRVDTVFCWVRGTCCSILWHNIQSSQPTQFYFVLLTLFLDKAELYGTQE